MCAIMYSTASLVLNPLPFPQLDKILPVWIGLVYRVNERLPYWRAVFLLQST